MDLSRQLKKEVLPIVFFTSTSSFKSRLTGLMHPFFVDLNILTVWPTANDGYLKDKSALAHWKGSSS